MEWWSGGVGGVGLLLRDGHASRQQNGADLASPRPRPAMPAFLAPESAALRLDLFSVPLGRIAPLEVVQTSRDLPTQPQQCNGFFCFHSTTPPLNHSITGNQRRLSH